MSDEKGMSGVREKGFTSLYRKSWNFVYKNAPIVLGPTDLGILRDRY
jgi:hypothetical protein